MTGFKQRLPNLLTISRIVVIPLMMAAFYLPAPMSHVFVTLFFLYASVTDFFDGWLARRWQAESALGRFLDPIADKLLVAAALVYLVADGRADALPATIILLREVLVAGLREHLMEKSIPMPVSRLAKYKTAVQMVAITLLLAAPLLPEVAMTVGKYALWLAALLTAITGGDYLKTGLKHLKGTS